MNVLIGQYMPGNSIIHKLNPKSKLIVTFIIVFIIFLANNFMAITALFIYVCVAIFLARIKFSYLFKGIKPVLFISLFTIFFHIISTQEGDLLGSFYHFHIYKGSLYNGLIIALRLLFIFIITLLLTLTTTPMEITDGIESLLSPFKKVKLPVHELALMMAISLRFIPTMMQETSRIVTAQKARGSSFTSGSISERFKSFLPLFIPLFVGAFKKADELAIAMEARGYRGSEGRSKYRTYRWNKADSFMLLTVGILALILYMLRT